MDNIDNINLNSKNNFNLIYNYKDKKTINYILYFISFNIILYILITNNLCILNYFF